MIFNHINNSTLSCSQRIMKTREQLDLPLFRKILVLESDHFEDITLSNVNNNAHGVLPCRVLVVHLGDQLLWIVRVRNIFLDLRWREVDMLSVEPQKKKNMEMRQGTGRLRLLYVTPHLDFWTLSYHQKLRLIYPASEFCEVQLTLTKV